jgi:hypothetical protein
LIDRRCAASQNTVAIQADLITDLGGIEHVSTVQEILVELVGGGNNSGTEQRGSE